MSKLKSKKLAAIALSSCMALCVGAAVGINAHSNFATASADTAKYAVTENFGTYKVSQDSPVTVKLTGITAGQYSIKLSVISATEMGYFYNMIATVGGESVYLTYNSSADAFVGVIKVDSDDADLTISTTTTSTVEVAVDVDNLYLGEDNEYRLPDVQITAGASITADLNVAAGNYNVSVDLGFMATPYVGTIYAQAGNGTPVTLTRTEDYMPFTGTVNVGENDTLTITNFSEMDINATISISEVIEYGALPTSATLETWMPVTYKYTAATTGYKYINVTSAEEGVYTDLSVTFKTSPDDFDGVLISEENYPIYVEAGVEYYVEILLMDAYDNGEMVNTATVNIATGNWTAPTITPGVAYNVPVTAAGRDKVEMNLVAEATTYNLSLLNIPFTYYWTNEVVTAHIGGQEIYLTADNGYATTVTLTGNTTIFLTTSAADSTVASLYLAVPEVREYFTLGEAKEITVGAGETAVVYIENAMAGYYDIMLSSLGNAQILVTSSMQELPIIPVGATAGGFKIRYEEGDFALEFTNEGDEKVTFEATVNEVFEDVSLDLVTPNKVSLTANVRKVYYLENLAAGEFELAISNLDGATYADLTVTIDGVEVTIGADGKAMFKLDEVQDANGLVTVVFYSTKTATFTVTVNPNNFMEIGKVYTVSTSDYYYYTAYYMNLPAGNYAIVLELPEGMSVTVTANDEFAVYYGASVGTFTVESTGYVALRFSCYTYGTDADFSVYVKAMAGEMKLGETMNVSMTATDMSKTYMLNGLASGEYNLTISNADVKVYVDGNLLEGDTFTIYGDSCTITFMYNGAVNFTAKVTPANILEADEDNTVTIGYWEYSKTYFMELGAGSYNIVLDLPEGVSIQVTINGNVVIPFGGDEADFTISAEEAGYIQITFETSSFEEVTFDVTITEN